MTYGFGLSHAIFGLSDAAFSTDGSKLAATCKIRNTGGSDLPEGKIRL